MRKTLDDAGIRLTGIKVLNKSMGAVDAYRFLALMHREPTDYVKISKALYEGQTLDDIIRRVRRRGPLKAPGRFPARPSKGKR